MIEFKKINILYDNKIILGNSLIDDGLIKDKGGIDIQF